MTGATIDRPKVTETTALGAALLAAVGAKLFPDLETACAHWQLDRRFESELPNSEREKSLAGWKKRSSGPRSNWALRYRRGRV